MVMTDHIAMKLVLFQFVVIRLGLLIKLSSNLLSTASPQEKTGDQRMLQRGSVMTTLSETQFGQLFAAFTNCVRDITQFQ